MRAMIVGAGLGSRLRPLTDLCPRPAVPVRGLPLVAYQLHLLARHGVREVMLNIHHLPELLIDAARRFAPPGMELHFSHETELLDTGGGIRRVASFLRESDPCLLLGADMLLDADLARLVGLHRERKDAWTMLLRDDPRAARFGSIGIDAKGRVRRIGHRFELPGAVREGLYVWANVVSARAFERMPEREAFGHLDAWLTPWLAAGAQDVRGEIWDADHCSWEPVGTPGEYLAANLAPARLSYLDADALARARGVRFEEECVIGAGASLGAGARLRRVVIWDGEHVPAGFCAHDGVFAGGVFHPCDGPA
ncbi:MAG: NDP-sugar synthase [Myxococcales bacterium]|nr:MAG: NDP-sugar synthase [Myxococcales bacterium]